MPRSAALCCALALAAPVAGAAQTANLAGRAAGRPAGIAVPKASVAGAEEPAGIEANPAALGFVERLSLQYFHEGRGGTDLAADGFWLATPLGRLVPALAMQWVRPAEGGGARFRKTTAGLAFSGSQVLSVAVAGNWFSSPSRDLDRLWTLDAGVTVRPWRHLSLGAAVLGLNDARLDGRPLPVRYDLGVATRFWRDRLTLSADLLLDDRGRNELAVSGGAVGLGAEIVDGLALWFQLQFPLRSGLAGADGTTFGQLAIGFDGAHGGVTLAGGGGAGAQRTWLAGARLSAERYRSPELGGAAIPVVDASRTLSRPRALLLGGDPDPYRTLLRRLREARDGPAPALVVQIDDLPLGQGRVEELRRLLLEVNGRKPVLAYLTGGGMKEYYLASAADLVLAPPAATLFPRGLAASGLFARDLLAKVGVGFDVVAIGRYKNAPDPLVRQEMSEAQREVTASVLDDLYQRQVRAIAASRGLAEARVRELIDTGVFSAEEAVAARLVDATAWPDELARHLGRRLGHGVGLTRSFDESPRRAAERWGPRRAVALVRVEGAIATGESRSDPFGALSLAGAETVARLLRQAAADREVVAVVLRVDSPGGDVLASDLVWREVRQARRAGKPVVASMGDLATSGGYLMAVAADALLAEPSTLTGSIGVFALKPDLSGLLGKVGVSATTFKRGEHADLFTLTRRWTDEERRLIERQVRSAYDLFLERVAEGRRLTRQQVETLAEGRVWTGAQAAERGLVDRLGSLDDAVGLARELAGYSPSDADVEVRFLDPPRSLLARLTGAGGALAAEEHPLASALRRLPEVRAASLLLALGPLVALPPEWLGLVELSASPGPP